MLYLKGSKEIKTLLNRAFSHFDFSGLSVLDFPSGSGFSSNHLSSLGAQVTSWDMFPEFFKHATLTCDFADLQKPFPITDEAFDFAIFQEGIEHLPDQLFALKEFHRVLKNNGTLFVTTPNYSNLRSRWAYLLFEAETPKMMPPNEIESLWFGKDQRVYMGHVFSIGIMRLRMLSVLAGFQIQKIHPSRINWTSFFLGLLFFPPIVLKSFFNYARAVRKLKLTDNVEQKKILFDLLKLNLNPTILLGGHLIVELKRLPKAYQADISKEQFLQT